MRLSHNSDKTVGKPRFSAQFQLAEQARRLLRLAGADRLHSEQLMMTTSLERQTNAAANGGPLQEPIDSLSIELRRISAEIQSINSGFQVQIQQAVAENRAAMEIEYSAKFEKAVGEIREQTRVEVTAELRNDFESELKKQTGYLDLVRVEMANVTTKIQAIEAEIASMLADPTTELAKVIRKRLEHAELQSYLSGLKFCISKTN